MKVAKKRLPESEVIFLRGLRGSRLHARAIALHDAGWPLASIGEALDPPRGRSTVRTWVTRPTTTSPQTDIFPLPPSPSSPSSDSSYSTLPAAEKEPLPTSPSSSAASSATLPAAEAARPTRLRRYDPDNPSLTPYAKNRIRDLAPVARRYRSGMSDYSDAAQANMELTIVCRSSYTSGVTIRELAEAAGVTYKAMERRVRS